MSRFIDIRFLGDRQLQRKLDRLSKRVQSKAMRDATKKALVPVMELAKRRAPVKTGRLRDSIKIAVFRGKGFAGAVVQTGTRRQLGISADARFYYPAAHEYGTQNSLALAFMRASLSDRRKIALQILTSELRQMMIRGGKAG